MRRRFGWPHHVRGRRAPSWQQDTAGGPRLAAPGWHGQEPRLAGMEAGMKVLGATRCPGRVTSSHPEHPPEWGAAPLPHLC